MALNTTGDIGAIQDNSVWQNFGGSVVPLMTADQIENIKMKQQQIAAMKAQTDQVNNENAQSQNKLLPAASPGPQPAADGTVPQTYTGGMSQQNPADAAAGLPFTSTPTGTNPAGAGRGQDPRLFQPGGNPGGSPSTDPRLRAMAFYMSPAGGSLTAEQAAGRVGALTGESGQSLNPTAFNAKDPHGGSSGIMQWNNEKGVGRGRLANGQAWAKANGLNWSDPNTQLAWSHQEDATTENRAFQRLKQAQTPEQAVQASLENIRPYGFNAHTHDATHSNGYAARVNAANRLLAIYLNQHPQHNVAQGGAPSWANPQMTGG